VQDKRKKQNRWLKCGQPFITFLFFRRKQLKGFKGNRRPIAINRQQ
jgi:hypothetical protein